MMNCDLMLCTLCPRRCGADRSVRPGFCGLGEQMLIARAAPHLWEEPPVSGARGTGAVFFSGCTLRCVYCQNGDISHRNEGRPFTPRELSDTLRRLCDLGVHTLSFITGTPFVPRILEALELWRPPLPLVWNTSGYETVETLRMLEGVIEERFFLRQEEKAQGKTVPYTFKLQNVTLLGNVAENRIKAFGISIETPMLTPAFREGLVKTIRKHW